MENLNLTVLDLLYEATKRASAKEVCYESETDSVTPLQVLDSVKKVATGVARLVTPNSPVVVISDKSVITPSLYMGVLHAGCYYVPLGIDVPVSRIKTIMSAVDAKVVLVDESGRDIIEKLEFNGKVLYLDNCNEIDESLCRERKDGIIDTQPQYILFTSGSTGNPKGVVTSRRSVVDYVKTFAETFDFKKTDIMGNQAPLDYIAGIRDMFIPLLKGCKTVLIPKSLFSVPVKLFEYISERKINVICWVSSAFTLLYDTDVFGQIKPQCIEKLFFTGSVMPPRVYQYIRDAMPDALLVNHYGPTEITASCTYFVTDKNDIYEKSVPIGKAFANRKVFLLDENNKEVKAGETGEICVSGVCLANGYFRNEAKTLESFVQNPLHNDYPEIIYRTGDIGSYRADGVILFHGRADRQIKHMGHRIELGEIEAVASECTGVAECACIYDTDKGVICLFYSGSATSRDLSIRLRETLPSFMIPRKFVCMECLPRLFNGKFDLIALKKSLT